MNLKWLITKYVLWLQWKYSWPLTDGFKLCESTYKWIFSMVSAKVPQSVVDLNLRMQIVDTEGWL